MRTLGLIAILSVGVVAPAQPGFLRRAAEDATGRANRRNDLEGGIWEYKVIERTGDKQTVLVGKIRIKQSAAFDIVGSAEGTLLDKSDADREAPEAGPGRPFGGESSSPRRLGVLDRVTEGNRGGDRIADITYKRSRNSTSPTPKVTFKFDTDDKHPLSGEAQVKYDTRNGGGVWRGSYYEVLPESSKKKKWTFELRFVEN